QQAQQIDWVAYCGHDLQRGRSCKFHADLAADPACAEILLLISRRRTENGAAHTRLFALAPGSPCIRLRKDVHVEYEECYPPRPAPRRTRSNFAADRCAPERSRGCHASLYLRCATGCLPAS